MLLLGVRKKRRLYQDAIVDEEGESPPGYNHPVKGNGIEMGTNAFAVSVFSFYFVPILILVR
jgi:hypothetical protein